MEDPTRALSPPKPAEKDGAFFSPLTAFDYLSPSSYLFGFIKEHVHIDVIGDMVTPMVGHWERVSAYGDALTKLSQCLNGVSTNVVRISTTLDGHWDGNAADGAHVYFGKVSTSLTLHANALAATAEKYQQLAIAMYHHRKSAEHMIKELLDAAMESLIFMALAAALAKTVVGGLAAYGMAIQRIVTAAILAHEYQHMLSMITTEFMGVVSVLNGLTKQIDEIGPIATVTQPYRHPSVRC